MFARFVASGGNFPNGEEERNIDTDILVDVLRGVKASRDYLLRFGRGELVGSISAIVVAELF